MIAIPDFSAGAMENWGLITYRQASILYMENVTSDSSKQWIVQTITHELAHQVIIIIMIIIMIIIITYVGVTGENL